jgi:hypothetical protein
LTFAADSDKAANRVRIGWSGLYAARLGDALRATGLIASYTSRFNDFAGTDMKKV